VQRDFGSEIESYCSRLKATLDRVSREELNAFLNLLLDALERGSTVYVMGNGGSAATASHFAVDFNKGLSYRKARRFRFVCLNDNVPTLTAYANDVGYEEVFVQQLRNLLDPGDLVIGISGSGNSPNVVKAIEYANSTGAATIGITGYDGGALKRAAKHGVHVPIADMQVTEDLHMVLDHLAYAVLGGVLPGEDAEAGHHA
jgi:D-sedoheptulose 7-phosphate isomerase